MFKGLRTLFFMVYHFIINTKDRNKYRVDNQQLDVETQKLYSEKIYRIMQSFCRGMIKASGSEIVVMGKENLPTQRGNLYVSNHRGFYDPMSIAAVIDDPCIFIGKDEVKKMPIISTWFDVIGSIYMIRDDPRQALESIKKGTAALKNHQSLVIYPEGTRSKTGQLGEFKSGSFKLAFNSGATIIPIAIKNTECIFENNKLPNKIKSTTIYVNIGKPIEVTHLSRQEQKLLPKQVEQYVQELFDQLP